MRGLADVPRAYTPYAGLQPWISDGTDGGTHMIVSAAPAAQSSLSAVTRFGDRVLFPANDPQKGSQLRISDGTADGTHVVKNTGLSSPIAVAGNTAFFSGNGPESTDGTQAGTVQVATGFVGSDGISRFVTVNGNLVFNAPDSAHGASNDRRNASVTLRMAQ